jgi:hypothetical protein
MQAKSILDAFSDVFNRYPLCLDVRRGCNEEYELGRFIRHHTSSSIRFAAFE